MASFASTRSTGDLRRAVRWSRSREGRSCFIAALAGVALTLGFYRSEASSAASAGPPIAAPAERYPAQVAERASVRSEPLALTPTTSAARADTPPRAIDLAAASGDVEADGAPPTASADAPGRTAPPKVRDAAASRAQGKKATKGARKAKRQALARGSSRGARRAKVQRATSAGPLAAWLATQRSKETSANKRR